MSQFIRSIRVVDRAKNPLAECSNCQGEKTVPDGALLEFTFDDSKKIVLCETCSPLAKTYLERE